MLAYPLACMREIARHQIRAVHLLGSGVYFGLPFLFDPRVAVVVSLYNVAVDGSVSASAKPLFRLALRRADAIDVLSDDIADRLIASEYNRGAMTDKLHVTPCSFTDYSTMGGSRSEARTRGLSRPARADQAAAVAG